jgi:hypothetical protein
MTRSSIVRAKCVTRGGAARCRRTFDCLVAAKEFGGLFRAADTRLLLARFLLL